jgi:hypothetical protein
MTAPVTASEQDLRTLAGIVSEHRDDPPAQGLPPSLLADLKDQVGCDKLLFEGIDSTRRETWFGQAIPLFDTWDEDSDRAHWQHHWDWQPCSYPDRTGDLRSIVKIADFYSARQWHSTGMYSDWARPQGLEHQLQLCLPAGPGKTSRPGRTVRLFLYRGYGADFSERDRALLTLLRPHLRQAYLDAERRRHPAPPAHPAALGRVAPARRRAHQHPDRPPPRPVGGNRAHPPGKHLWQAKRLQPHRRRHPRLP